MVEVVVTGNGDSGDVDDDVVVAVVLVVH